MFHRTTGVILALVIFSLPAMLMQPGFVVSVTTDDGRILVCRRMTPDERITLTFTHSMFGGDVREIYRADGEGELVRERMVTDNAASAEYYATDGRTEQNADGYDVISPPFSTDELVVRVDDRGNHQLTIGQASWNLADGVSAPTRMRITIAPDSPSCDRTNATGDVTVYKETFQ